MSHSVIQEKARIVVGAWMVPLLWFHIGLATTWPPIVTLETLVKHLAQGRYTLEHNPREYYMTILLLLSKFSSITWSKVFNNNHTSNKYYSMSRNLHPYFPSGTFRRGANTGASGAVL